jgi:hypothetical protein
MGFRDSYPTSFMWNYHPKMCQSIFSGILTRGGHGARLSGRDAITSGFSPFYRFSHSEITNFLQYIPDISDHSLVYGAMIEYE